MGFFGFKSRRRPVVIEVPAMPFRRIPVTLHHPYGSFKVRKGFFVNRVDELMESVSKLGNDMLVAQARAALEIDGHDPTPEFCKAAFLGIAHLHEIATRAHDAGTLSANEMIACQSVASLCMQIWATLHDILMGKIEL